VLLDTHTLLWFLAGDPRLSRRARTTIESRHNVALLSDVSLWEIAIKQSLGKLKLAEPMASRLLAALERNAIEGLAIQRPHLLGVAQLPFHHRDPFDRLLVSTALIENLPLVTDDPSFGKYAARIIW
jgi:PIN domain nuclease of toxin-antitoxin system